MRYVFVNDQIGSIVWEDGKLSGTPHLVKSLRALAKELSGKGEFYGIVPLGPGTDRNYLRNPWAAFFFIKDFFRNRGTPVKIIGRPPEPEPPEEGVIQ